MQLKELFPTAFGDATRTGGIAHHNSVEAACQDDSLYISRLKSVQGSFNIQKPSPDRETNAQIPRPGSFYKHFRTVGELSLNAKVFYEAAANLAGIGLPTIVSAVFLTETKLQAWSIGEQRSAKQEELASGEPE